MNSVVHLSSEIPELFNFYQLLPVYFFSALNFSLLAVFSWHIVNCTWSFYFCPLIQLQFFSIYISLMFSQITLMSPPDSPSFLNAYSDLKILQKCFYLCFYLMQSRFKKEECICYIFPFYLKSFSHLDEFKNAFGINKCHVPT